MVSSLFARILASQFGWPKSNRLWAALILSGLVWLVTLSLNLVRPSLHVSDFLSGSPESDRYDTWFMRETSHIPLQVAVLIFDEEPTRPSLDELLKTAKAAADSGASALVVDLPPGGLCELSSNGAVRPLMQIADSVPVVIDSEWKDCTGRMTLPRLVSFGCAAVPRDDDGVARRAFVHCPRNGRLPQTVYSLSIEAVRAFRSSGIEAKKNGWYQIGELRVPVAPASKDSMFVRFPPLLSFTVLRAEELLNRRVSTGVLKGKIVFLGIQSKLPRKNYVTPAKGPHSTRELKFYSGSESDGYDASWRAPGALAEFLAPEVLIHAAAASTILEQQYIAAIGPWVIWLSAFLVFVGLVSLVLFLPWFVGVPLAIALGIWLDAGGILTWGETVLVVFVSSLGPPWLAEALGRILELQSYDLPTWLWQRKHWLPVNPLSSGPFLAVAAGTGYRVVNAIATAREVKAALKAALKKPFAIFVEGDSEEAVVPIVLQSKFFNAQEIGIDVHNLGGKDKATLAALEVTIKFCRAQRIGFFLILDNEGKVTNRVKKLLEDRVLEESHVKIWDKTFEDVFTDEQLLAALRGIGVSELATLSLVDIQAARRNPRGVIAGIDACLFQSGNRAKASANKVRLATLLAESLVGELPSTPDSYVGRQVTVAENHPLVLTLQSFLSIMKKEQAIEPIPRRLFRQGVSRREPARK